MMKTDRDPTATLLAELNGSCKPHIIAGINGNLPPGWSAGSVEALPTHQTTGAIAVFAGADKRTETGHGWHFVGAKIVLDAPADHLKIADELARQLCEKIRDMGPPRLLIALEPGAIMPTRGSEGASGYDLYAPVDVMIRRGATVVIHSGVRIELPDDTWEAQIRPRSSMSARGLVVALGTVDSDYRGIIGATVTNLSTDDQTIKRGDRYAQMVLGRVEHPQIEQIEVAELTKTARGPGGFGSSGR